jgi:DNA-binding transcriptional MerR regulator
MSDAAQELPDRETWSIAELAAEFDVTLRTIRFYEDLGLISPARRGTQRVFGSRDRIRLKLILRGRRLGMTLDEIRTIIDMYDAAPGEVGQLHYLLEQLDARRADLEERRRDIEESLVELDRVEAKVRADLASLSLSVTVSQRRPSRREPKASQ